MAGGGVPYEFDGFRFFVWSLRHHRYETAYIERKVVGYYPVTATKGTGQNGAGASFSLIVDDGGQLVRKSYVFNGYRVNLTSKEPYVPGVDNSSSGAVQGTAGAGQNGGKPGMWERLKRLFGRK
jgi:hypothetical protein